jgi:hypothetical protein
VMKSSQKQADDLPREFYQLADQIGMREAVEVAGEVLRLVHSRRYTTRQIARRVAAKAWRKYGRRAA